MPLRVCPPEGTTCRRGLTKNGVLVPLPPWAKEPAAGAAEYYFCGGVPFCLPKKEPKMPRGLSPRSASTPVANPRTPLRGTLPWGCSAHPARAGKGIAVLSAPLAGQFGESLASWTGKARLVEAAVGAGLRDGRIVSAPTLDLWYFPGPVRTPAPTEKLPYLGRGRCLIGPPSMVNQTVWQKPGGPGGSGKPKHLPRQGPVARKEGYTPLKFCPPEGTNRQRGRKKRRFGSFAAAGKGTRRRGGGIPPETLPYRYGRIISAPTNAFPWVGAGVLIAPPGGTL